MRFASALSKASDPDRAIDELRAAVDARLAGANVDLAIAFVGADRSALDEFGPRLRAALGARVLVGCTAGGTLGAGTEHEAGDAVALAALAAPEVAFHARHLTPNDLPDPDAAPDAWRSLVGSEPDDTRGLLVLADPFTADVQRLLDGLDYAFGGVPKFGGLSSGGRAPGSHRLYVDDEVRRSGTALLAFGRGLRIDTVVAQGCSPFGEVGRITRCHGHVLQQIDGHPALRFVHRQLDQLDEEDRQRANRSPLFLGIEMDPFQLDQPTAGEFLIRNLIGFDRGSGALEIGAALAVGRRVQLHLRNRSTSAADLRQRLQTAAEVSPSPAGALLFACMGRGQHLYGEPDHDSRGFAARFGADAPLAGFFCNGEIGPVGGNTHLHGYTSVFGLLCEEPPAGEENP